MTKDNQQQVNEVGEQTKKFAKQVGNSFGESAMHAAAVLTTGREMAALFKAVGLFGMKRGAAQQQLAGQGLQTEEQRNMEEDRKEQQELQQGPRA